MSRQDPLNHRLHRFQHRDHSFHQRIASYGPGWIALSIYCLLMMLHLPVAEAFHHSGRPLSLHYCTPCHRRYLHHNYIISSQSRLHSTAISNSNMLISAIFDDDLPNILGINPIEAAILGYALYYFYGPNTLYEFAREAGRLFSTYAPVVQQVSLDIFYEFRDYLEEDRERELLRKSGVNVDAMPRRTSNVIERFQKGMEAFSDMTGAKGSTDLLKTAYQAESDASAVTEATDSSSDRSTSTEGKDLKSSKGRKKKREVLEGRNVNVEKVIEATRQLTSKPDDELAQVRH